MAQRGGGGAFLLAHRKGFNRNVVFDSAQTGVDVDCYGIDSNRAELALSFWSSGQVDDGTQDCNVLIRNIYLPECCWFEYESTACTELIVVVGSHGGLASYKRRKTQQRRRTGHLIRPVTSFFGPEQ